ncbi:recombinase family protein [Streptomyces sp. NBC_01718]|uniref:recombinase family protein n=1 Tax=Streptomyces sp. NBC_01718 TaxID=2975919 RepID=UPI00352C2D83
MSEDKALKPGAADWRGTGEQVADQFKDIDELAARLGVTVIRRYDDNNTPASDPLRVRKEFEELLTDLESGTVRGVLFYHADRLARLEYDAARINRLFLINPHYIGKAVTGGTDLATAEGRSMFTIQATMGGVEVAATKRRVSRKNKSMAERGLLRGAPRPFGWAEDRKRLHEQEAELVREAILGIPRGLTIGDVRRQWIALGFIPKPNGASTVARALSHSTVESRLVNPRVCGYVTYLPQSDRRGTRRPWLPDHVVHKDGKPVKGEWEAIVSPEEWADCVATIEKRKAARKEGRPEHSTSSKYLLSGVARCGKCSFPLHASHYSKGTGSYERYGYRYACLTTLGGCGGITRVGPPIEDLVEETFLIEVRKTLGMTTETSRAAEVDETRHDNRLVEISREIEEVNVRRRAKHLSMSSALDLIEELEQERGDLIHKRRSLLAAKVARRHATHTLIEEWESFSVTEKKARLKESIRAVIVHPAGRGARFDPALIEIIWKSDQDGQAV